LNRNIKLIVFTLLALVIFYFMMSALNIKYNGKTYKDGTEITVTGSFAIIGSEPLTEIVLIDEKNDRFLIPDQYKNDILKLSGKKIEVKGVLSIKLMVTAKDKKKIFIKYIKPVSYKVIE
jgi:hypothetical protein